MTTQSSTFQAIPSTLNLPQQEEEILKFWDERKIFEKSLNLPNQKNYSFYDGPPFATGLPHYGHLLAGIIKDIIPRYWTMQGYRVPRRFGWDCHGLPVEYEINKLHHLESKKDVLRFGIANYNAACRSIVKRYATEWKQTIQRTGRWVNMEQPYFTMDLNFMQSVWWVFKELYQKQMIYEGYKVMPYSTGISTALSNFEANLNYKMTQDPAITVRFPLINDPKTSLLAWTTTPWTLPSNLALAIGENLDYVKLLHRPSQTYFILAQARYPLFFSESEIQILETFQGSALIGLSYLPPFDFFLNQKTSGAFQVIAAEHVTHESGTGIVHLAPAFGEEDALACQKHHLPIVNPVDEDGMFTAAVPLFQGRRVKETDSDIIDYLKQKHLLFKQETIDHSYPFCYRSDTPLIYRAVSSWFLQVEAIKTQLIEANQTTHWIPEHLREGRFGNWLENARDWAISRNRFWGTPLPIWKNPEGEILCIGSQAELEQLSQRSITDLHRESIDSILIPSPTGKTPLTRIEDVFDCWFESGAMPYAQHGFPFHHQKEFETTFPADFIAEGLDQTRGWFYTLMVLGTALFQKAPFRHVVVNGLVLAEDGRKMSKSLKNYPDPMTVLNESGADALRLYLIHSPVVKGQELKFSKIGVRDVSRKILYRWWNAYSFFINYARIDHFQPQQDPELSKNILDQWILSRLHHLIHDTTREMAAYKLYQVVPHLLNFIEELTNTYIRFNRSHFWQEGMPIDKRSAYQTLYDVLLTFSRLMAPFTPFLAEIMYQNLAQALPNPQESVHLDSFPTVTPHLINPSLEKLITILETLVSLGRNHREKLGIKAKIPLKKMTVIHRNLKILEQLKPLETYFQEELNLETIAYDLHEDHWIQMSTRPRFDLLGKRFGAATPSITQAIRQMTQEQILQLEQDGFIMIQNKRIDVSEIEIHRQSKNNNPHLVTHPLISLEIDPTVTPAQINAGIAREVIRKIQIARKNARLNFDDRIHIQCDCDPSLQTILTLFQEKICHETLCLQWSFSSTIESHYFIEIADLEEGHLRIGILRA